MKRTSFERNGNWFLHKPQGETLRFLRNRFLVVETKTTVENGVFRQVPVSTAFFLRNVDYRHVSGNIGANFHHFFGSIFAQFSLPYNNVAKDCREVLLFE